MTPSPEDVVCSGSAAVKGFTLRILSQEHSLHSLAAIFPLSNSTGLTNAIWGKATVTQPLEPSQAAVMSVYLQK